MEDQTSRVPGNWFCWIFGNIKDAFLPDETPDKLPFGPGGTHWDLPFKMVDGNIAVSKNALEGPDVWLEFDDKLFKALFLSRELGDALDAAGLRQAFGLYRVRVI